MTSPSSGRALSGAPLKGGVRQTMRLAITAVLSAAMLLGQYTYCESLVILIHSGAARAVLLDPQVFQYLHTELSERQPLLLSNQLLLADESQLDLPFDIQIVPAGGKGERKAFRFTGSKSGESETLVVTFAFAPAGIETES